MPLYPGNILTATAATVSASPTSTRTWKWLRNGTAIPEATASGYVVTDADISATLTTQQIETNFLGLTSASSAETEAVSAYSPSLLFALNEPGVWYDPSDVANLNWRVNLLQWTQEFDNAAWSLGGISVSANTQVAPDGTLTADTITHSAQFNSVNQNVTLAAGTYTLSYWLKAGSGANPLFFGFFNGAWNTGPSATPTSSWVRHSYTFTSAAQITQILIAQDRASSGFGSSLIWGAQLEVGGTATDYQRITDVNTEVRALFPNATLYQDNTPTSPVTTPGQTVGLMLDKSRGGIGPEIVTNGNFSAGSTDWTPGLATPSNWTFVNGVCSGVGAGGGYQNVGQVVSGRTYVAEFTLSGVTGGGISLNSSAVGGFGTIFQDSGVKRQIFTAAATGTIGFVRRLNDFTGTIDNFSIKELPGNHAVQATLASRPLYGIVPRGGRRNILTFSQDFENAAWSKLNATITANSSVAPDGTSTADLVSSTGGETRVGLNPGVVLPSTTYTASMFGKYANANGRYLWFRDFFSGRDVGFDLQTGVVTQVASGMTASVVPAGEGFFRCIVSWTTPATAVVANQQFWVLSASGTNPSTGFAGGQLYLWGAQIELAATATAYQRVTTQYDVTEAGVQSLSYLAFDGGSDSMATGTITPGTDKVQVFAGVRKLSDAAQTTIVGAEVAANGIFELNAPGGGTVGENYSFRSRGTTASFAGTGGTFLAPTTNVLSAIGDISGDRATLRVNGTQAAQSTSDQGTGNYLAYPLYIGARGGTSLFFNGNLFGLITRFGPNLASTNINATEAWLNNRTGAY
jgi:hypothetical protein